MGAVRCRDVCAGDRANAFAGWLGVGGVSMAILPSSLCSSSPTLARPPSLDPTLAFLSPSAYHRMLLSIGRLHGVLAKREGEEE